MRQSGDLGVKKGDFKPFGIADGKAERSAKKFPSIFPIFLIAATEVPMVLAALLVAEKWMIGWC